MRKPEQLVWDAMRCNCPDRVWLQRVENIVGVGMPDVFVQAASGRMSWVELKAVVIPKREETSLVRDKGLSPEQKNWHRKSSSSYVLIRDSGRNLYLFSGRDADEINRWTKIECEDRRVASTWQGIFEELE